MANVGSKLLPIAVTLATDINFFILATGLTRSRLGYSSASEYQPALGQRCSHRDQQSAAQHRIHPSQCDFIHRQRSGEQAHVGVGRESPSQDSSPGLHSRPPFNRQHQHTGRQ
jgi:hypothetical protein